MLLSDGKIDILCGDRFVGYNNSRSVEVGNQRISIDSPMIAPYVDHSVKVNEEGLKIPSYGLSSGGYDVRLAPVFKVFTNPLFETIDPMNPPGERFFTTVEGDTCTLPPGGYLLSHTVETFNIPENVLALCLGKSTWARWGVAINVTPIEPGFKGQVVIEIANQSNSPVVIRAGVGICQFLFLLMTGKANVSYADRNGKYQNQTGITLGRL